MDQIPKLGNKYCFFLIKKEKKKPDALHFLNTYSLWASIIFLNDRLPTIQQEVQQRKLLYMGLYLLIWGEAANLRFMPECICYIYHHVWCE